jgi:hypothetical protein
MPVGNPAFAIGAARGATTAGSVCAATPGDRRARVLERRSCNVWALRVTSWIGIERTEAQLEAADCSPAHRKIESDLPR